MTDEQIPDAADRALRRHDAFRRRDDGGFDCTTTPFQTTVRAVPVEADGRDAAFIVRVVVPTLDAATEESVADVVEDGWFDTLSLRLADAYDAPDVDPVDEPSIDRGDTAVEATFRFRAWSADAGVDDAKAIVDYVEGTYVQGIVPGYTYVDPVAGLLERARDHGGDEGTDGARRGGTPL